MLKTGKWTVAFVIMVCLMAIYYVIPNLYGKSEVTALPGYASKKQVILGLDLQGGSHLLLEVDTNSVLKEKFYQYWCFYYYFPKILIHKIITSLKYWK